MAADRAGDEEGEEQKFRDMFDTNFFGLAALIRRVLARTPAARILVFSMHDSAAPASSAPSTTKPARSNAAIGIHT